MRIVIPEPKINIGEDDFTTVRDGMPLDLVGRQDFGERLSNLVDRIEDPAVIALDGDWGTGKSVFLKLWAGAHVKQFNKKGRVIYYDAFADDWRDDPLGGLIMALENAGPEIQELEQLKKIGFFLLRTGFSAAAAYFTAGLSEVAKGGAEALEAVVKNIENTAPSYFHAEEERKKLLERFRKTLRKIASKARSDDEGGAGLIFIIDELDRCRPDFALSLLEIVKHIFNVDGVVFILGTNLSNLGCMVSSKYGQNINGEKYLRKLVNIKLSLPRISSRGTVGTFGGVMGESIFVPLCYFYEIINKIGIFSDEKCIKNKAISEAFLYSFGNRISLRDVDRFLERVAVFGESRDIVDFFIMCIIFFSESIDMDVYKKILSERSVLSEEVRGFLFSGGAGGIDNNNSYYRLLSELWTYLNGGIEDGNVRSFVLGKTKYWGAQDINQENIIYDYFDISPL